MSVFTDQPGLLFYSGNFLGEIVRGRDSFVTTTERDFSWKHNVRPILPTVPGKRNGRGTR